MPLCFSALMCHAPIVVPTVAKEKATLCERTTRSMREVAQRACQTQPDRLVLISPHSPRLRANFCAWRGEHIGHLGRFGHPKLGIRLPDAPEVATTLDLPFVEEAAIEPHEHELDHGAVVPLLFLAEAGWHGPTSILSVPWEGNEHEAIGRALAALPGKTAVIASGDMSHRLKPGAPAGYHPKAQEFDLGFVEALERNDWAAAIRAPWQEDAAEDVVDSTRVALAAAGAPQNAEVLSYEGPWGVGYTQAIFFDPEPPLYAVAREAVRCLLAGRAVTAPPGGPGQAGAFVTLRKNGQLRGCIGHIGPTKPRLYEEIVDVAQAAAMSDPRFDPVSASELDDLVYEVSVLYPPEPIPDLSSLDPQHYGVIVQTTNKRGLLLPGIEGITEVAQQVQIAKQKAGIAPGEACSYMRFRVIKVEQPT